MHRNRPTAPIALRSFKLRGHDHSPAPGIRIHLSCGHAINAYRAADDGFDDDTRHAEPALEEPYPCHVGPCGDRSHVAASAPRLSSIASSAEGAVALSLPIVLDDVSDAMNGSHDHPASMLDCATGAVFVLAASSTPEDIERMSNASADRFVEIPRFRSFDNGRALALLASDRMVDPHDRARLLETFRGPDAFDRFHALFRSDPGLDARFLAARAECLVESASAWLTSAGIVFTPRRRRTLL